nr:protein PFC0760c-like isoform X3 [Ipomoea batatas]
MGYVSRLKVAVYWYLQALLGFFSAFLFRMGKGKGGVDSLEKSLDFSETSGEFTCCETETEAMNMSEDSEVEGEKNSGGFTFRFPTYEEFISGKRAIGIEVETVDSEPLLSSKDVCLEVALNRDLKQSDFEGEDVSNEENEISDIHVCSKEETEVTNFGEIKDLKQSDYEGEDVSNEENENSDIHVCSKEETEVTNFGEIKDLEQSHPDEEDVSNEENENVGSKEETEVTNLGEIKDLKQSHPDKEDVSNEENENSDSDVCRKEETEVTNFGEIKDLEQSHPDEEDVSDEENENVDIHVCSKEETEVTDFGENKDLKQSDYRGKDVSDEENENPDSDVCRKEETEVANLGDEKREFGKAESDSQWDLDFTDKTSFKSEKDSLVTDSDSASLTFEHMQYLMGRLVDSYSEGFLSDEDFGGEFKLDDDSNDMDTEESHGVMSEENQEFGTSDQDDSAVMDDHLEGFKQDGNDSLETMESEFLSENDFHEGAGNFEDWGLDDSLESLEPEFLSENDFREDLGELEDWDSDDEFFTNNLSESGNPMSENESDLDYGDANKMESLWEHQDLLEQIKMELKKVRATGLPTIFEESESPKMDDLKPWKIDERFQREDCIGELMKFNKSYRERMRKLDILTYQKLYAIGFVQKDPLKDPFQLLSSQKSSGPALKSLKSVWPFKQKSGEIDPVAKFIKEIQCELEVVYVGQMCLSWEFLHWQYGKALDLWDSDPRGIHRYNEVAGQFQQFQVLLQRFIEDERFQGPRVRYYIKSRYDFRNLLQVPVIREDNLKDRKKAMKFEKGNFAITSDILVEILEECIRIFWRFVKGDNDSSTAQVKCHKGGVHPEIENADDLELLMEVRRSLQKKERKLRDTLRSENCVLRRFRRSCRDDDEDSDHVLYFFSQVDMKLVSRVLNMSRLTTKQLVWCHNKLSRIRFVNRRIHVDPSFLLFPC